MAIRAFAAAALMLALSATALAEARPRPDDPAVPLMPTPPASAYENYRPYREEPLLDWRAVNEEVRDAGGHMGHVRDGNGAKPNTPAAPSRPVAKPPIAKPSAEGHKHAH
jgi:hypothetical protein